MVDEGKTCIESTSHEFVELDALRGSGSSSLL